jgi:hypothetical protein
LANSHQKINEMGNGGSPLSFHNPGNHHNRLFPFGQSPPPFLEMAIFDLSLHGTKFSVRKRSLINFFLRHPELFVATTYEVQSRVPLNIFQSFVKALETGTKISVIKENASAVSLLAKEFWLVDLVSESPGLQAVPNPEFMITLYASTSNVSPKLEHQMSTQVLAIMPQLKEAITIGSWKVTSHRSKRTQAYFEQKWMT